MDDLEQQIRDALARKDPPANFEARVLAAIHAKPAGPWWRISFARLASAAAVLAMLMTGIAWRHERVVEERHAGEAAKARLELALKIASGKLNRISERVAAHENN